MGSQGGLQGTRPAATAVLGISPAAELSLLDSQMHTSNRSACHPYSNRVSVTSRTAVYGPVRTVVWEGWSREAPPYPDHWPSSTIHRAGRGRPLCPGISDVNFLGNLDGIVNLNTEITDGALNFGVAEQELNRTQISGSAVN